MRSTGRGVSPATDPPERSTGLSGTTASTPANIAAALSVFLAIPAIATGSGCNRRSASSPAPERAKTQAGQPLAEVKADAERRRAATQREVDELTRQKDSVASHLAQVRQLLGGQMPGTPAVQAAQAAPAVAGDPAWPVICPCDWCWS